MKTMFSLALMVASTFAFSASQGFLLNKASQKLNKAHTSLTQETHFYEQKLDHENAKDTRTFKQRYFIDSQYAVDAHSPVFLIVCGEWNCDAGTNSSSFLKKIAQKLKGHLVAAEHRFYGESMPTTSMTTENLKLLSLGQAVSDLAELQKYIMETHNLNGKWTITGGSYAGTLASSYRLKHPELVVGALASSAPVLMKNEFFEYDAHIAKVINTTSCGDQVRAAVALIEEKIKTPEGALELRQLFKATEVKLDSDFMYIVADMLAYAVQTGKHKMFCDALAASSDLVVGYADGGLKVLAANGTTPVEISFQAAEKVEITKDDMFRQWMWQSCTEFGWFQVANGTDSAAARSSQVDLKYHDDTCQRLFQIPIVANRDNRYNETYYLPLFSTETSHIIFSNGGNDPWSTLSITSTDNEGLPLFVMEGAAHCNDLRATITIPAVIAAQVEIGAVFEKWLAE